MPAESSGFTLVELLIVIAIIGILTVLVGANYLTALRRGRDAQRKSDLKSVQTALRIYYNDAGRYPCDSGAGLLIRGCSTVPTSGNCTTIPACGWDKPWDVNAGATVYMSKLAIDPSTDRSYRYDQSSDDVYVLKACLENGIDPQCVSPNEVWCSSLGGCIYQLQP